MKLSLLKIISALALATVFAGCGDEEKTNVSNQKSFSERNH